jgi:hypothetical protein
MAQVHLYYDRKLDEIVEAWADSLTPNNEDFVFVDGEEGDFGVIRFFGKDLDGNENVHMITQYIRGGDVEQSYYTLAGADIVQKIMRENFETVLRRELEENLDPGQDGGMSVGFVKAYEEAEQQRLLSGKEIEATLHQRCDQLFPDYFEDGQIFKYGFKLFVAHVLTPPTAPAQIAFRNLINEKEMLAIKLHGKKEGQVCMLIGHIGWRHGFNESRICVIQHDEKLESMYVPVTLPISEVKVVG